MLDELVTETISAEALGDRCCRLLYVEDNAHIAELTTMMLEDAALDVVLAGSAEEALEIAAAALVPFDMVLTDVVMPGLSGVQLAMRLNRRWPEMPVVLTSGYGDDLVAGRQYELLNKPFTRRALIECIERNLIN